MTFAAMFHHFHDQDHAKGQGSISSREFEKIKRQLLHNLTNFGRPFIYVVDGNYGNRGELYLMHDYEGTELKHD